MNLKDIHSVRAELLKIYSKALKRVAGRDVVRHFLQEHALDVAEIHVIAIGKAAAAMAHGALDELANSIGQVLIITKDNHCNQHITHQEGVRCLETGHPVPDRRSLQAGQALLEFIQACDADTTLLFLISGGTSALVEVLPENIDLSELEQLNQWLLSQPLSIDEVNAIRRTVSRIKGGKLKSMLGHRRALQLLLSDVPSDDPAIIGSGMLVSSPPVDINGLLQKKQLVVPDLLKRVLQHPSTEQYDETEAAVETYIVATNDQACEAALDAAKECGFPIISSKKVLSGDANEAGKTIASTLIEGKKGFYLWGGETTVTLPVKPGIGGRNQSLALAVARSIADQPNIAVLAAGTDGSDGPTQSAGALVDGLTIKRGEQEGLSSLAALENADAGTFLEASSDLIDTGPTGTNVMDLVMAVKF